MSYNSAPCLIKLDMLNKGTSSSIDSLGYENPVIGSREINHVVGEVQAWNEVIRTTTCSSMNQ